MSARTSPADRYHQQLAAQRARDAARLEAQRQAALEETPLFAGAAGESDAGGDAAGPTHRRADDPPGAAWPAQGWPQVRPAGDEQLVAPIGTTNEAKYQAWKATPEGARVIAEIIRRAVTEAAAGATRVSTKRLTEIVRAELRVSINNTFPAFIARDLVAQHPALAAVVERRERKAT